MASAFAVNSAFLAVILNEIKDKVSTAKYLAGSTWYTADIASAKISDNGTIDVTFMISANTTEKVTKVQLYTMDDVLIGEKTVSISKADAATSILYALKIELFQVMINENGNGQYDRM